MPAASDREILPGLWRFTVEHPEWTEDEGGEDGWEPEVAWWAVAGPAGLVLVDPLVTDWTQLDQLVRERGGCAGIIRTCHWHQRSIAAGAERYRASVWAKPPPEGVPGQPFDTAAEDGKVTGGGIVAHDVERSDEIALWLPEQRALLFGDAMLRRADGGLRSCPDSWTQPEGGSARLRAILRKLSELPVAHVLVSHGPFVTGDGAEAMAAALG